MSARAFFALPFVGLGRFLSRLRLDWQINACSRDLDLTNREIREKLIASRALTIELINLQSQRNSL